MCTCEWCLRLLCEGLVYMQGGVWGPVNIYLCVCVCVTLCACVCQRVYTGYDGFEWVQRLVSEGQHVCVCTCARR